MRIAALLDGRTLDCRSSLLRARSLAGPRGRGGDRTTSFMVVVVVEVVCPLLCLDLCLLLSLDRSTVRQAALVTLEEKRVGLRQGQGSKM